MDYTNFSSKKKINGTDSNDTIYNSGVNVTINGNGGNDSIKSTGKYVTIDGGDGNDTIQSWGSVMTINAGNGNDYIGNHGGNNNARVMMSFKIGKETTSHFTAARAMTQSAIIETVPIV